MTASDFVVTRSRVSVLAVACAVLASAATWLFVYNSGLGYDALEYLVIGRSLHDGHRLYDFVPSKSWGLYAFVGPYLRLPGASTRAGVAMLITGLLVVIALSTFVVVQRRFGGRAATLAAALVMIGALFMELNYLEAEAFVFLAGLSAFALVTPQSPMSSRRSAAIGLVLGLGVAFKVVATLYLPAAVAGLILISRRDSAFNRRSHVAALILGFLVAVAVPAMFFAATSRLQPHLLWSYVFPILQYPSNTDWVSKLYTKLLWIWLLVAGAAIAYAALRRSGRVNPDFRVWLLVMLGISGLVPLLKTQASHYAFPGAAFLLIFVGVAFDLVVPRVNRKTFVSIAVPVIAVITVSGVMYRPDAISRLFRVTRFDDATSAQRIDALASPAEGVIFVTGSTRLYWATGRYPAWPVLNTDVQTTYLIRTQPDRLMRALDDPAVRLVEFDPEAPGFDDAHLLQTPAARSFIAAFNCRLRGSFTRHNDAASGLVLWLRKPGAPVTPQCEPSSGDAL